jgi:hypothetical protein
VSGAEHGHPLLVEPTELVDLPGLDELDRLQDLGRCDPVGGPTLVGFIELFGGISALEVTSLFIRLHYFY